MDQHNTPAQYLRWGIKESFRNYLGRQADFSLNVYGGASVGAGNAVHFPLTQSTTETTPAQTATQDGVLFAGQGQAMFLAHHGMMRLSLKNPIVRQDGSELTLAFDFGTGAEGTAPDYFEVARLVATAAGDDRRRTFQAFLLPEATGMFNDMYEADSELDAVIIGFEES